MKRSGLYVLLGVVGILVVVLCIVYFVGVGEEEGVDVEEMAIEYVEGMSEFLDNNGRDLKVTNFIQARCVGCYVVELEFLVDSSDADMCVATVTISDWEVSEVLVFFYGDEDSPDEIVLPEAVISMDECAEMGGEVYNVLEETEYDGVLIGRVEGLNCPCACRVDDYSACKEFFDGCNTCYIDEESGDVACTEMDCENLGEAYCVEFW